jgi:hypothetical protein
LKNANIFVDVDLTLVDHNQHLLPGAREALRLLAERGCHLFLWSSAGAKHAQGIAARHGIADLFEGFVAKPDIVIDDTPGTVLTPFVFDPTQETSWQSMVESILKRHID